jgi:hypothetical protein
MDDPVAGEEGREMAAAIVAGLVFSRTQTAGLVILDFVRRSRECRL